jgi:hypothetical protein
MISIFKIAANSRNEVVYMKNVLEEELVNEAEFTNRRDNHF